MASDTTIVVPCYNEASRLPVQAFKEFAAVDRSVRFVFVDDGSTDDTPRLLQHLAASGPERFIVLTQSANRGKAEAVRVGMLHACAGAGRYAGYWDADLSTPLSEISCFVAALDAHPAHAACFGARVRLLGRTIERRRHRHYVGRVFATAASLILRLPVYDTQCGAKLFRVSPELSTLFAEPFTVGWTFDVEVVARLARERYRTGRPGPHETIYELPLNEWRDVPGSKVQPADFFVALIELLRIRRTYSRELRRWP